MVRRPPSAATLPLSKAERVWPMLAARSPGAAAAARGGRGRRVGGDGIGCQETAALYGKYSYLFFFFFHNDFASPCCLVFSLIECGCWRDQGVGGLLCCLLGVANFTHCGCCRSSRRIRRRPRSHHSGGRAFVMRDSGGGGRSGGGSGNVMRRCVMCDSKRGGNASDVARRRAHLLGLTT